MQLLCSVLRFGTLCTCKYKSELGIKLFSFQKLTSFVSSLPLLKMLTKQLESSRTLHGSPANISVVISVKHSKIPVRR